MLSLTRQILCEGIAASPPAPIWTSSLSQVRNGASWKLSFKRGARISDMRG